jgi:hypothetical protein
MGDTFQVRHERCDTCVFRLKYPAETRRRLFADVARSDGYVACHKYTTEDEETGEEIDSRVCCKGFYDREPYQNPLMRIAHMTRRVEYVDEDGTPIACPLPQG